MKPVTFPFIGPAYESRSANYSSQRMVNLYLEKGQGKTPWVAHGTPGLTAPVLSMPDITSGPGGIRGAMKFSENSAAFVSGGTLYFVSVVGGVLTANLTNTIVNDGRPVTIAYNGIDAVFCTGGYLYWFDVSSHLIRANVDSVDFIDGYFILSEKGTGKFYVSDQYNKTVDSLNFATAEGAPDKLVKVLVHNREAILFGTETTEFWYVSGNVDFPMSRVQGAFIEEGLAARDSAINCGDTVAWLGASKDGDSTVWMLNGYRPQAISTNAISYAISRWERKDDAYAFFYKQEDHAFYVLSSPTANETWCYDFSTGMWHERAYLDGNGNFNRIRPAVHLNFNGQTLVGDWENGNVYEYDLDTYTDNGEAIKRLRSTPTIQDGLKNTRNTTLRIDMDVGVGVDGDDPVAALRYSKDGGKTWSSEIYRSIGRVGEYGTSVEWNRVGGGERSVYELSITDPVKVSIAGAYLG